MTAPTTRAILRGVNSPHLKLHRGGGYWYFEYYDALNPNRYDTLSVYTMRLSDLPLERWVEEGRNLVNRMEEKNV